MTNLTRFFFLRPNWPGIRVIITKKLQTDNYNQITTDTYFCSKCIFLNKKIVKTIEINKEFE